MMVNFLFWNVKGQPNSNLIGTVCEETQVDILALAKVFNRAARHFDFKENKANFNGPVGPGKSSRRLVPFRPACPQSTNAIQISQAKRDENLRNHRNHRSSLLLG
jgi:hypothetical protein